MAKDTLMDALVDLGFTDLEADVYVFLLDESPATGYRVAQGTGRLPANVYKAIESLEAKGAVLVDQGSNRHVRALPPDELLALQKRRFEERQNRARKALATVRRSVEDDRVYGLNT